MSEAKIMCICCEEVEVDDDGDECEACAITFGNEWDELDEAEGED